MKAYGFFLKVIQRAKEKDKANSGKLFDEGSQDKRYAKPKKRVEAGGDRMDLFSDRGDAHEISDKIIGRVLTKGLRISPLLKCSFIHNANFIGDSKGFSLIMCNQYGGNIVLLENPSDLQA